MLNNLFKFFLFFLSIIIPRNKNILIFGDRNGRRFCDNSRYLFFYLNNLKNKRCIWLSKDFKIVRQIKKLGYETYLSNSIKGIYFSIISKWHIYNFAESDINNFFTKFSNNINLWHGVLFKKLVKNKKTDLFNKVINFFYKKYIIYPNKRYSHHLLNHYSSNKYKLIISNQPRNFFFIKNAKPNLIKYTTSHERKICKKIQEKKKKIIGYFPTWRKSGLELFPKLKDFNEIIKLNLILKKKNTILLIKKHPNSDKKDMHKTYNPKIDIFYNKIKKFSNFYLIDYDTDLNSIMHLCDMIISDYSGAVFDYLLLNRTIIFYVSDLKEYENDPGLNFNLRKIKIGPLIYKFKDLLKILNFNDKHLEILNKKYESKRKIFKEKIFESNECFKNIVNLIN